MYGRGLDHGKFKFYEPGIDWNDEGVMEMGNSGNVPGATGQGAREEGLLVIDEMSDDNFDDLLRKPGDRGRGCHRSLWRSNSRTHSPDSSQVSVPNSHGGLFHRCIRHSVERKAVVIRTT